MTTNKPIKPEYLRADAEGRLREGTAPPTAGWALDSEALSLLFRLASDPESSADAMKLLHELQTHQVELDLQHAQLADSESELALLLAHFQVLFEHAPAGYLVLGRDGCIIRSNRAASELFGLEVGQLEDHMLTSLLSPVSKPVALVALESAGAGCGTETVRVQALDSRPLVMAAGIAPGENAVLVLVFPEGSAEGA